MQVMSCVAAVRVKLAVAVSEEFEGKSLPEATTNCVPAVEAGTVNVQEKAALESECVTPGAQDPPVTGMPS